MTVTHAAIEAGEAPSVAPLIDMLSADMAGVNATIIDRMASEVPLIPQLAGHLIVSGGKRMRPMMTVAGAMLGSGDAAVRAPAIKLATAVEFIHSATLLHDDVIDESKLRRGQDTANELWGNDASVLVGDFLFARAFELMVEAGDITVLGRLASAAARITEGEIKQMAITGQPDTPVDDYFDVIGGKTAVLFSAAAAAGIEITVSPSAVSASTCLSRSLSFAPPRSECLLSEMILSPTRSRPSRLSGPRASSSSVLRIQRERTRPGGVFSNPPTKPRR
ncbi:MAG: polyprenyl synthetase family protein, partial [Candidatus Puniceispirillaceae bacterium]